MKYLLTLWAFCWLTVMAWAQGPIAHGHAHNDYVHARPLAQALENGFTSIEIDVFLHKGKLVVSHIAVGLDAKPTIEELYLDPIKKRIEENEGWVYKGIEQPVTLMIDFKTDGEATYKKLNEVLEKYGTILTQYRQAKVHQQGAVNILISGSKPVNSIQKEATTWATLDAGIDAINQTELQTVSTRYSASWGSYFSWQGKGNMPAEQKKQLETLVAQVHTAGKEIRFWAIPDKPKVWQTLLDAGVDWINTDKLEEYRKFWEERNKR